MSYDGHRRNAEDALRAVLGGDTEELQESEQTPQDAMSDLLAITLEDALAGPGDYDDGGYGRAALNTARAVLEFASRDPERFGSEYDIYAAVAAHADLKAIIEAQCGITGFQWGWAVNHVRWLLEAPPIPNPAIVEVGL